MTATAPLSGPRQPPRCCHFPGGGGRGGRQLQTHPFPSKHRHLLLQGIRAGEQRHVCIDCQWRSALPSSSVVCQCAAGVALGLRGLLSLPRQDLFFLFSLQFELLERFGDANDFGRDLLPRAVEAGYKVQYLRRS